MTAKKTKRDAPTPPAEPVKLNGPTQKMTKAELAELLRRAREDRGDAPSPDDATEAEREPAESD
jgi:hypothetical protein